MVCCSSKCHVSDAMHLPRCVFKSLELGSQSPRGVTSSDTETPSHRNEANRSCCWSRALESFKAAATADYSFPRPGTGGRSRSSFVTRQLSFEGSVMGLKRLRERGVPVQNPKCCLVRDASQRTRSLSGGGSNR